MNGWRPAIKGDTRFIVMLGKPISQVRTPALFNELAMKESVNIVMLPVEVGESCLKTTLDALRGWGNCCGAVVTYPYKAAAFTYLDSHDTASGLVCACNVIRREGDGKLHGGMTDGLGFVAALRANGFDPGGARVRLIGAGGAGSAIALALADSGAACIQIADSDRNRADRLAERVRSLHPGFDIGTRETPELMPTLVCNATPLGMQGEDEHPFPVDALPPGCLVADIVPDPEMTPWLEAAIKRGHPVQTGRQMVTHQLGALVSHLLNDELCVGMNSDFCITEVRS